MNQGKLFIPANASFGGSLKEKGTKRERPQLSFWESARLERTVSKDRNTEPKLPPSPTSKSSGKEIPQVETRKRKQSQEHDTILPFSTNPVPKRPRISPPLSPLEKAACGNSGVAEKTHPYQTNDIEYNPLAHWAATGFWPPEYSQHQVAMNEGPSSKRRSESTHRSSRLERLAENGVFMKTSALIQRSSKDVCEDLLKGNRIPIEYSSFPPEIFLRVLERVQQLNESRIQRDITPWVVPSAELLFFCGEPNMDYIGDEVNAEWIRCSTLGSTRPKPDYVAGLLPSAFTKDEIRKLENYASPSKPFFFTPYLCFPFLICEVKSGEAGLNKADRQNIHSASIAVGAIIELYKAAFGDTSDSVKDLYGKILVFTVSHNHDRVCVYGHYAVATDVGKLEFYRYPIALFSLSLRDGADRFATYNFVRNVYDNFAPEHLQRIRDATALLPELGERTNLSFAASELALDERDSQQNSEEVQPQDDTVFKLPSLPASALQQKETIMLREQISKLIDQLGKQREDASEQRMQVEQQLEQQRKQMEQQLEQQRKQMEQQLEQQRKQMEQMEQQQRKQMEQMGQMGQMEQQLEQLRK